MDQQQPAAKVDLPGMEYSATVSSPIINGEAHLFVTEHSLVVSTSFEAVELPYATINAITMANYIVSVKTDYGDYSMNRMGSWSQPFYDTLCDVYNRAVLRSLFIKGSPAISVKGDYSYTENSVTIAGVAKVYVYDDAVVILPPDTGARRIPLRFTSNLEKGDYQLTLTTSTGDSYCIAKIGYATEPFADIIEQNLRSIQKQAMTVATQIDPTLTPIAARQIAKLMPVGVAVSIGVLDSIATSFVPALEKQISTTRAADYYQTLLELTDRSRIAVGLIDTRTVSDSQTSIPGENQANTFGDQVSTLGGLTEDSNPLNMIAGVLGRLTGSSELQASLTVTPESQKDLQITDSSQSTTAPGDSYLFWIIAPSPDNQMAIVEFAVEDTATFVYATDGDYDGFVLRLNMALEAIAYKREAIWLSDDELHKPQNADYYMAAKRTAALKFVRSKLVTRIIHSSVANWRQKLLDIRHV